MLRISMLHHDVVPCRVVLQGSNLHKSLASLNHGLGSGVHVAGILGVLGCSCGVCLAGWLVQQTVN